MGILTDRIREAGRQGVIPDEAVAVPISSPGALPSDAGQGMEQVNEREQAIIDRRKAAGGRGSLLQRIAEAEAQEEIAARRQQRAYAEQAPPELVDPAREMISSLGDRAKVLDIYRKLSPEQRQEVLKLAPGIAQQLGDDRGGAVGRTLGAVSRGVSGVAQPIAELVGLGGTAEEIEFIRQLEAAAAQEFNPARPGDPWYERGPLQAVEQAPWMATVVGGAGIGRAAATGIAGRVASSAAAGGKVAGAVQKAGQAIGKLPQAAAGKIGIKGVPALTAGKAGELAGITAAAFPTMYAQEVDQLKELGMEDNMSMRLLAGGTAAIAGLIEGIVPNPFKAGEVSLTGGALKAARQYLWNAAKNAPGEMSEEYLQGVTSGLGAHVAQYLDDNAEEKSIADAFKTGWEQAKESALPMAFLLGVPAVGGAGLSAIRAQRLSRLQEIRAKGFVSADDAKELGIQGNTRKERQANADAEIEQLSAIPPELPPAVPGTPPALPPGTPPSLPGAPGAAQVPPALPGPTGQPPALPGPSGLPPALPSPLPQGAPNASQVPTNEGSPQVQGDAGQGSQVPGSSQVRGSGQDQGGAQPPSQEPAAPEVQVEPQKTRFDAYVESAWKSVGKDGPASDNYRKSQKQFVSNSADYGIKMGRVVAFDKMDGSTEMQFAAIAEELEKRGYEAGPIQKTRSDGIDHIEFTVTKKPDAPATEKPQDKPTAPTVSPDAPQKGKADGEASADLDKYPLPEYVRNEEEADMVRNRLAAGRAVDATTYQFYRDYLRDKEKGAAEPQGTRATPPAATVDRAESKWQSETRSKLEAVPALKGAKIETDEKAGTAKVTRPDGLTTTIHFNADEELAKAAKEKLRNPKSVYGRYVRKPGEKTGDIYIRSDANHTNILNHEVMHWLEDQGVVTKEEVEQHGGREAIAEKYGKWAEAKQRKKDSVFQRIYDALEPVFSSQRRFFEEVGTRKSSSSGWEPAPKADVSIIESPDSKLETSRREKKNPQFAITAGSPVTVYRRGKDGKEEMQDGVVEDFADHMPGNIKVRLSDGSLVTPFLVDVGPRRKPQESLSQDKKPSESVPPIGDKTGEQDTGTKRGQSGEQVGNKTAELDEDQLPPEAIRHMMQGDRLKGEMWRSPTVGGKSGNYGAFYATNEEGAGKYSRGVGVNVVVADTVELNNPLVVDTKQQAMEELGIDEDSLPEPSDTQDIHHYIDIAIFEAATEEGYDGVVYKEEGYQGNPIEVHVFNPPDVGELPGFTVQGKKPVETAPQPAEGSLSIDEFADIFANPEASKPKKPRSVKKDPSATPLRKPKSTGKKKTPSEGVAEGLKEAKDGADLIMKGLKDLGSSLFSGPPINRDIAVGMGMMANGLIKAGKYKFAEFIDEAVKMIGAPAVRYLGPYLEAGWNKKAESDGRLDKATSVAEYLTEIDDETVDTPTGAADQAAGEVDRRDSQDATSPADAGVLEGAQTEDGGETDGAGDTGGVRNRPGGKVRPRAGKADPGGINESERGSTDSGRVPSDDRGSGRERAPRATRPNYHLTNPDAIIGGGPKAKFERNRKAIEIVRDVEETGRAPTAEELDTLAGYTGWGAFGQELFKGSWENPRPSKGWEEQDEWLRIYLGEEDWKSAQQSIVNAHYTDPQTVTAMWDMLRRMGFNGGRVLEPSMGIGNFFSLMPRDLMDRSSLTGIELDTMTAKIATLLHPQANIQQKGYQESQTPDNFYDVILSNVPFGNYPIADRRYKQDFSIHNYFFKRAFDQVKPGGVIAFLTSNTTMDGKTQAKLMRAQIAEQGDLVTAIRLPSGAFQAYAGTKVVADLIVIRKRKPGEEPVAQDWINIIDMDTPAGEQIPVNEYWEKNPQNILGTMTWGHGTTSGRPGMIVQQPDDLQAMLDKAVQSVPEGIINTERTMTQGRERPNTTAMRQNSVISQDGDLWIVKGEQLVPLIEFAGWYRKGAKQSTIATNRKEIEGLLDVREAMRVVLDQQAASEDATDARAELNRVYDAFVAKHGPIGKSAAARHLRKAGDPAANTLLALEEKKGDKYVKRPIFSRPTVRQRKKVDKPTVNDAFAMERNRSLDLDIDKIAATANVPVDEVIRQLESEGKIYKTGTGTYDAADVFLSGNMARKLRQLQAAKAEGIEGLERSIDAVRERLPEPVPYSQIEAKLGATWVEASDYADFLGHLLNEPASALQVERRIQGWKTTIPTDINNKTEAQHTHGHRGIEFNKLVNAAMNNATVKLTMPDPENPDSRIADPVATAEANAKIGELREKFSSWIWTSPERITRLSAVYNEEFNSTVTPEFDDVPLQFEGMTLQRGDQPFNLRKHQESAVWRGIVSGKGIFAHEVGTGKTLTIAALAMESRRLGLASKPLLLAHNANSMAVRNEVMEAYPNANVLYIDNLDAKNKSAMLQAIATENWDLIVVPHSMAERFQLRPETVEALLKPEMDALEAAALEAFEESESSDYAKGEMPADLDTMDADDLKKLKEPTAKELVKERLKLRAKIEEAVQAMQKGEGMFFEDMGIDMVMVDEAHLFKKLPITTKQNIKGLNKTASQRGTMLMMLTDYVRNMNNGRGAYLFTGTPITNTINEIYNMMRFVMAEEMEASGVRGWDGWFNNFATQETLTELSSGGTWENFDRLSSFVNLPELRQMVGQYMDIVFADEMPEFRPRDNREGRSENPVGRPYKQVHNVTTEMLPAQESHSEQLKQRYTTFKNASGKEKVRMMREAGGLFNPLVIEGEGVKLAMDPRLVRFGIKASDSGQLTTDETKLDPKDPRLKINRMLHNAMAHYQEHPQSAQMIFMQIGHDDWTTRTVGRTPAGKPITERVRVFNLAREIKRRLMEEGVPENEIAMFSTMTKEKRTETAQLMKEGKVRFAIGSTETMGTGVNAQDELIAMHHLDAPWMPGDLEQRNGRGHRQGNKWNTVHEYRYLTEGPQDGRRWQVLLTKSRFIEKFMKADGTERTIEMDDVDMSDDGAGNDMEKTFAAAAGDPRIMMRIRLEDQVAKLERSRDNHARTITETVSRANQKLESVERQRATITEMQGDYQTWLDNRPADKPVVSFGMKTVAFAGGSTSVIKEFKAKSGLEAINDELKSLEERYRNTISTEVQLGEYRGLPLFMNNGMLFVGNGKQRVAWSLASLQGVMANTPERIAKIEKGIEKDERFIEMAHKAVGEPFPKQKQLDSKRAKLDALLDEMESNPDISPAWLRAGAPIGTVVFHKGLEYEVSGHRKDTEVLYSDGDKFVALPAKELTDKDGTPIFPELQAEETSPTLPDEAVQGDTPSTPKKQDGESRALDAFTSPELQDRQSMGAARVRIASAADLVGDEDLASGSEYASPDKEFERRWQPATKGIGKKSLATKLREFWEELVKSTVRGSLPELPRTKQFGEARSAMHAYQNAPVYAQLAAVDLLKKTTKPLSASDYDLFARVVIMRDQVEAASKNERLSFGLTPARAKAELDRVEALAENNERVQASLEYRRQWTEAMVDDFLSAHEYLGLDMSDRFKRENYFRHQVLYYMEAEQQRLGKKKVELTPNRSWLKGRTSGEDLGEAFDINASYLQAEWEVSTQMIADTKRAQAIGRLKRHYDKMRQLKEDAKYNNYVAVVGGQENMDEIEELRGMIAELRESGSLDSADKQQLKEWSERLWELDPTMPFRQQMSIARDQIERGAKNLGEEVPADFMRYVAALAKQEDSPLQPAALSFLKAVADRKAFIKNALGDEYQTWEDVVPDDHEEVAIRPGRAMFQAYSVPEQVASALLADLSKTLGISAEDLRPLTALGAKYTPLVVPQEVAAQMAAIDSKMDFGWLDRMVTRPMSEWKRWALMGPTRVLKYNLRNLSEIDKVMALNPAAIKDIPQAIGDLWKLYSGADEIPATVRDWVERGGSGTLVRVNELGELNELKQFAKLIADKKSGVVGKVIKAPANAWKAYWSAAGISSDFRESILRYAAYLNYLKQLEAGKLTNYGGSVRAEVDGIQDKRDKAMRLSADLLGDYGDISLAGQFLRSRLAPFWSFQETNVRTYFRGLLNLASNEQSAIKAGMQIARAAGIGGLAKTPFLAYKLGRIAILFYGFKAMTTAFNQLLFPDDDDELPDEEKRKSHLTFGRNSKGEVQYFTRIGTAADVLDWVGLDSVDYDLRDVLDGRRTIRQVLDDMKRSPVDKAYGMLSPFIKAPTELAVGQTAYPNVGKPRPIRDSGRYIAQNLGLSKEYDKLTGKPSTPYSVSDLVLYKVEPGAADYYLTLDAKFRWLKTARNRGVGYSDSARGNALRNYKMAIRLKDQVAADKYLAEYEANDGTKEGLLDSLEWSHPAGGLSTIDAYLFYKSLAPVEQKEYRDAEQFYYSELLTEEQAKDIRARRDKRLRTLAFGKNKDGSPKGKPEKQSDESAERYRERLKAWQDSRKLAQEALKETQ